MNEVEKYLSKVEPEKRKALEAVRSAIKRLVPEAEEAMSYGMPAFKLHGKGIAGYAAFKRHCSYFPMSGKVIEELANELKGYKAGTGGFQFEPASPPSEDLVRKLLAARLDELGFLTDDRWLRTRTAEKLRRKAPRKRTDFERGKLERRETVLQ